MLKDAQNSNAGKGILHALWSSRRLLKHSLDAYLSVFGRLLKHIAMTFHKLPLKMMPLRDQVHHLSHGMVSELPACCSQI